MKPVTEIKEIEKFIPQVDFVQIMGSDSLGKHGISLEEKAVEKIKMLRASYPESIIGIDIGVNTDTSEILISAGANKLIAGSAILDAVDSEAVFRELSQE
jgi:pentose-5-phosphate-3-epimerase